MEVGSRRPSSAIPEVGTSPADPDTRAGPFGSSFALKEGRHGIALQPWRSFLLCSPARGFSRNEKGRTEPALVLESRMPYISPTLL